MENDLAPLEKLFRKVEEESERRACLLAEDDVKPLVHLPIFGKHKERRRASISISRIGQLVRDDGAPRTASSLTPISSLYRQQLANESNTSIASGASEFSSGHAAHDEDENTVTQMETIAGKPSLASMLLPRRLTRSHSTSGIPNGPGSHFTGADYAVPMQIGVSIQETITSVETTPEESSTPVTRSRRTSVVADATALRHRSSNKSLGSLQADVGQPSNLTWLSKAKNMTLGSFRRHSSMSKPSTAR